MRVQFFIIIAKKVHIYRQKEKHMKKTFEITDEKIIHNILNSTSFGTLALCVNNIPYSLPINFVHINNEVFFHGAKKGKKIDMIKNNANASFSVVEDYALLPSYFSNDKGDACPATHLFKSVIMDGYIEFIEDYDQKAQALEALMQKLQKEGKYIPLNHPMYKKAINATCLFKLVATQIKGKCKMGQQFNEERFRNVTTHLRKRATTKDLQTLQLIEGLREQQ